MSDQPAPPPPTQGELIAHLNQLQEDELTKLGQRLIPSPNPAGLTQGQLIDDMGKAIREQLIIAGELPASGGTTPTQRVTQADHGSSLTLAQAAARSGLSVSTWRRRIKAGKADGAYLAPSPVGDEWRIPVATVEAAAAEGGRIGTATQGDPIEAADLRARVAELEQQLAVQRALADERRAMLDQLHATVRALGAGIEGQAGATPEAPRRKWWGGKRN
jgi:hypothetical protein